ncbi:hypothetical protein BHE74_00026726 [Ensete ventricosum]|nr:hypothetical protein GW17_00037596 [Ensete ventricosum]RWW65937.1 hypothetical protein BHE74_00026726 [Ensete ventricosum]RZR96387.1 hypothetical protein BHM03_00025395 [Ensete ventricosum]
MEASAGLVAGSHNRNELVVIRRDGESAVLLLPFLSAISQEVGRGGRFSFAFRFTICGDDVGLTVDGDLFVACNECAFPICRTCYEYEHDLENEFNFVGGDKQEAQYMADAMLQGHMSYGRWGDINAPNMAHNVPQVPLLTNGEMVLDLITCCQYFAHAKRTQSDGSVNFASRLMTFLPNSMPLSLLSWVVEGKGSIRFLFQTPLFQVSRILHSH